MSRTPASTVTVERFFPDWSPVIDENTSSGHDAYAHGHSAACYVDGNGSDEDILIRARSGSSSSANDGRLYIAVIKGADLDSPSTWDSLWVATSITGLMYPAWTSNSGASYGGSISIALYSNGGTPTARVFFFSSGGALRYVDVNLLTSAVTGATTIASLGTGIQLQFMQLDTSKYTEVYVLVPQLVEDSQAAWHIPTWGTFIRRYYYSGSWQADNSFHHLMQSDAGLFRDGPGFGAEFSTSAPGLIEQWGYRFCGGLCVLDIGDGFSSLVASGMVRWRLFGYDTHSQGIYSYLHRQNSGWWGEGPTISASEFNEDLWPDINSHARGFSIEGANFVSFNRFSEPSDFVQTPDRLYLPRTTETVVAKLSSDGKYFTEQVYLGDPELFTAAHVVAVNHGGDKRLYALGWRAISESDPASFYCSVPAPEEITGKIGAWSISRDNRGGSSISLSLVDPSILADQDSLLKSSNLVRVWYGGGGGLALAGQGFVDSNSPTLSVDRNGNFTHSASVTCRADDLLLNTRAEDIEDILPQKVLYIPPNDPIRNVSFSQGLWTLATATWANKFFAGQYPEMDNAPVWRLMSFPYANTGGSGGEGDPGSVLNNRAEYKGTWFKDITWLAQPPMINGSVRATVRFGDVFNQSNFNFKSTDGNQVYASVSRNNGVITKIDWATGGYGGSTFTTAKQSAVMAGLLFHAPEVGRKYAFVWEYWSDFSQSSHTDDTWTQERFDRADYSGPGTGFNRLYLIISDFDGENWVNKAVFGTESTLTLGKPADLLLQVVGGEVRCYYRAYTNEDTVNNQWILAFTHKATRFGAGQFGLVGRGHAGIQWDALEPGSQYIRRCDNYVDFWNIHCSDGVMDLTMEEHLSRYAWRAFTNSRYATLLDLASKSVSSGTFYSNLEGVENLVIDFWMSIPSPGVEGGVFLRGVLPYAPTYECMKIGIVASNTDDSSDNQVNSYVVKRVFRANSEEVVYREYNPLPKKFQTGQAIPVRVTAQGSLYSIWIAGNYAGHFVDENILGLYFGVYAQGGTVSFSNVKVSELYEVTNAALLEVDQPMDAAIKKLIGNRRVKTYYDRDGWLHVSYFFGHATGPDMSLWQVSKQERSQYYSKVRVQGSEGYAEYQSDVLAERGPRYKLIKNPEIQYREFAWREARAIIQEILENQIVLTAEGLPDLRVDPEQKVDLAIIQLGETGEYLVSDITISYKNGDANMKVTVRQTAAI